MRVALGVVKVTADRLATMEALLDMANRGAAQGAELVLFPEAVLTGLANCDRPVLDLPLGQAIPGSVTKALGFVARGMSVWIGAGLLERDGDHLYDAAVLIGPQGRIRLHYRRNNPQWHGRSVDRAVYREGTEVPGVDTPWGRAGFLICGDLFDDSVVARAKAQSLDWLLFPFARSFEGGAIDQARWDREELPAYVERVRRVGATALMVNYLADPESLPDDASFGGAFVVRSDGTVVAQQPLGRAGLLVVDV